MVILSKLKKNTALPHFHLYISISNKSYAFDQNAYKEDFGLEEF